MSIDIKSRRTWQYGSSTVLGSLFFLGILVFAALIAERHPWRVDLTESGAFTLSEQTTNILRSMTEPVHIKAFYATAAPEQVKAKDLLETYQYASPNIQFEFIDPDRRPEIARHYEVRTYGTLVLEGYGRRQMVQNVDEESLTNALLKLVRAEEKKIYFVVGHGEHSVEKAEKDGYSMARSALEKDRYRVIDLNLLQQDGVPEDASLVILAGPRKPLFPQEVEALRGYLQRNGKLMVLLDPQLDGGLKDFLQTYGVQVSDDIIIDKLSRVFGGSYLMPVVMQYGLHKITANFDLATFYPEARSITPAEEPPAGVQLEVLASTSENAWAEKDLETLNKGEASFDDQTDTAGPVSLAVLAEIEPRFHDAATGDRSAPKGAEQPREGQEAEKPGKAFLLVVGDSEFANNSYFGLSGNGDLFLNMVNFLAEEESLITVKPRDQAHQPVLMTQSQAWAAFWVVLVAVPLSVLLAGLTVYRVRRAQR